MSYEHILVAVDLTEECDPVIKRAQALAIASGAKLSLVHIVEPMAMAFGGDVPMDLSQLQQQQFDQAKERLDRLMGKYPQVTKDNSHLTYGQPRQEIHHLAKEQHCDLIVVGSHGRHGLALLLGSMIGRFASDFQVLFSTASIVAAFACSTLIGVAFGFLPARNAAQLDPVEALARE